MASGGQCHICVVQWGEVRDAVSCFRAIIHRSGWILRQAQAATGNTPVFLHSFHEYGQAGTRSYQGQGQNKKRTDLPAQRRRGSCQSVGIDSTPYHTPHTTKHTIQHTTPLHYKTPLHHYTTQSTTPHNTTQHNTTQHNTTQHSSITQRSTNSI